MPIGIRPINDFAFKKTFGSPENKPALISLLNAILALPVSIADVTIENPFSLRDFEEDKLSILDVKAVDQAGSVFNIEIQRSLFDGLIQRIVFYGCEIYADQLRAGDDYSELRPAFSICLMDGRIWRDSPKVHHVFRLTDFESGRTLDETLEIHTLELGNYNLMEAELAEVSLLECWLFWLLHAHEYDADTLLALFPFPPIQLATECISRIAAITKDKQMYDAREKAARDRQWELNSMLKRGIQEGHTQGLLEGKIEGKLEGKREGKLEGKLETIRSLQEILQMPVASEADLGGMSLQQLDELIAGLQERIRNRLAN
ncbi:MAG: Rpn family recombination-promoting nuclease/putative transposase [Planctomycetales bacterium]|nr:Rpn family recombination-promoting nuclease/putative transposase [Planctomycetales bacterium]